MGTWQLYIDESGNFDDPREAVLVAGVLFEGRATPQVSSALRRRLEEIFVGSAYPPHAAHHNVAASLLADPLRQRRAIGPAAERFVRAVGPALAIAQRAPEAALVRADVATEQDERRPDLNKLRVLDDWLRREEPRAHGLLRQEQDLQRGELVRYASGELVDLLAGRAPSVVAAFQARGEPSVSAEVRYEQLYEVLIERALLFAARKDAGAQVEVHLAVQAKETPRRAAALNLAQEQARAFPFLGRAKERPLVFRFNAEKYGWRVAPGIVLADFAANRLKKALFPARRWEQVNGDMQRRMGMPATATCALLPLAAALPGVAAEGAAREAIRKAAEGVPAPGGLASPQAPATAGGAPGPRWGEARWAWEQAGAWIAAMQGEGRS